VNWDKVVRKMEGLFGPDRTALSVHSHSCETFMARETSESHSLYFLFTLRKHYNAHSSIYPTQHTASFLAFQQDVLLHRTRVRVLIFLTCVKRPPVWSIGQGFWLQVQRSRVRFPALSDFREVVGLERGPLSTTEVLLGRNSSGSGLESQEYGRGDPLS
jgi:hypothetical protein